MSLYFDNAATTPIDHRVLASMLPYIEEGYQNPSSPYRSGREIRQAIERARTQVATLISADPKAIVFTSGGTEGNNHAIKGIALKYDRGAHFITTKIEHHSVLDSFAWLEQMGYEVTYLSLDSKGQIDLDELQSAIKENTKMISIMWANNEIGSIQPIDQICSIAHKHDVLVHSDAVQAMATIDVNVSSVDLLTFSSHKIYGPKGCGALYVREGVDIIPLIHGGEQNNYIRGGTEATYNIIGFGMACELLMDERQVDRERYIVYKIRVMDALGKIPGIHFNGSGYNGIPTVINVGIKDVDTESLLIHLDMNGIQASLGAACNTHSIEPSHVLKAIGVCDEYIDSSIRLSFGRENTGGDVEVLINKLIEKITLLRKID